MWKGGNSLVTPSALKSAFVAKYEDFNNNQQQDAPEFLRLLLDSMHSALNVGTDGQQMVIDDNLTDDIKADRAWDSFSSMENSVIKNLFTGQIKTTLKCDVCKNTSTTFQTFWDLR